MESSNSFIAVLLLFYYWFKGIVLFFIPRSLRFKSVKDELVLITGGGSGLGRELAIRFAKLGAHIVVWDINKSGLDETVKLINKANPAVKAKSYVCDITDRKAVYELAEQMNRELGPVTILINNAGVVNGKTLMELDDEKIIQTFMVNVISHFWITKAFLPDMIKKNSGHLVSIASVAGQVGTVQLSDYCASKFACVGFEESLRMELRMQNLDGIKSTLVAPYFMNTGMFSGFKSPILPALEPEFVAEEIMAAILTNSEQVVVPKICYTLNTFKSLIPTNSFYKLYEILGGYHLMEDFRGRQGEKNNNLNNNKVNNNNRKVK